jgi:hypothetical protein
MDIKKFNNALLMSNRNIEKLAKKFVNGSSNAVVMEMFDDKCFLADHTTGQIFEADYSFDGSTFVFENFTEIEFENDDNSLREAISDYFDDKNVDLVDIYENSTEMNSDVFENSLAEALASKNVENVIDYSPLVGINEEIEDAKKTELFEEYSKRIQDKPMGSIKYFNWKTPVKVSVLDEDENIILNKSIFAKAKKLRSDVNFKKTLKEAAHTHLEGDSSLLEELLSENESIVALDEHELQELVGFSVIGDKELMDNRKAIVESIEDMIFADPALSEKKSIVEAEKANSNGDTSEEVAGPSEKDIEAIKAALEKAKEKAQACSACDKLVAKIDDIIGHISEAAENESVDVNALKEAVEILSL